MIRDLLSDQLGEPRALDEAIGIPIDVFRCTFPANRMLLCWSLDTDELAIVLTADIKP
jgi:hypothetical protein